MDHVGLALFVLAFFIPVFIGYSIFVLTLSWRLMALLSVLIVIVVGGLGVGEAEGVLEPVRAYFPKSDMFIAGTAGAGAGVLLRLLAVMFRPSFSRLVIRAIYFVLGPLMALCTLIVVDAFFRAQQGAFNLIR